MLRIRFQRMGKAKQPLYRIVVSEGTKDTQARSTEIIGSYNPHTKALAVNKERLQYWMGVGAQPSASINNLLVKEGLSTAKKAKSVRLSKKRKAKLAAKAGEAKA